MYYKDNNIEIRLGLGINEFKSITTNIFSFILSKLNEDDTITLIKEFTSQEYLPTYPVDGIYRLEVIHTTIEPYFVYLNVNDSFIKEFVNQVKDILCNCSCNDDCDDCKDNLNGNYAIKRQKLFNTTLILPNTIKPITYGQAPLTNPPLYNFFQLFFNETIVDKKVELGKEYFCFYSKGTVANNAELFNSIITGYYYGIYLYSKTLLLYNIPENLPLVKLEYTKKIDTIFDFKFIKNCLRCYTNNIDFNKIIEASFIGTDIIFTVPEQNNISRVINVYSSDLSGNGTLEEQISEYVNSLDYIKSEIDSDIWINYEENGTPPPPTPIDAVVSEWGDWGACIGNSSGASQIRTRTVLVPASNGGITGPLSESRPCSLPLEPTDAIVSAWSAWSECSLEGLQTRTRTIITPAANGGNTPVLTETQDCVPILPPIDAVVSNWDLWSDCSIDGLQARDRYIITPASNGGNTPPLREIRNCTYVPNVDCVMSNWSDWSTCSAGTQSRTRSIITPASGTGAACGLTVETRACTLPVDCVMSEWGAWSNCISGQRTRTRTVITPASGGGLACGVLSETEACEDPVIPGNCYSLTIPIADSHTVPITLRVRYNNPTLGYVDTAFTDIPLVVDNDNGNYVLLVCSTTDPVFALNGIEQIWTYDFILSGGTCTTDGQCEYTPPT